MIYLFEDRKGRMRQHVQNKHIISDLIEASFQCTNKDDLPSYVNREFTKAKVILFHASYVLPSSSITKEDIKEQFVKLKIPFVFFSGGLSNNYHQEKDTIVATVNSGTMYRNIENFINHYKNTGEINIPILLFGKNYLTGELIRVKQIMLTYFSSIKENEPVTNEEKNHIINFLLEPTLKDTKLQPLKNDIINYIRNEEHLTVGFLNDFFLKLSL